MGDVLFIYKRLINTGVNPGRSYLENKRTQMLNLIAAMCAPLTLFFLF